VLDLPELVEQVIQSPPGVPPGHPWACKPHDFARHFALSGFIAMDGAIGAGWLIRTVGALLKAPFGILHQFRALSAKTGAFMIIVVVITIDTRHAHKSLVFTL
jgi:hypothetical protein